MNGPISNDTLIKIIGYVTDPKLVGYQLLTNYESTYWRRVVGRDAWSLYEVLRSFCHEGDNTCHPSINYLLSILDFSDRTVLIGRIKKTKTKTYEYPGLIEVLQEHDLVIAEIQGEGPQMRYVFHVNLTPGLLSDAQLAALPRLLQRKHQALLERIQDNIQSKAELKKRRTSSPPRARRGQDAVETGQGLEVPSAGRGEDDAEGIGNSNRGIGISNTGVGSSNTGLGNSNRGVGTSNSGSRKFQPKQHPISSTKLTTPQRTAEEPRTQLVVSPEVVVALTDQGISKRVAERLAREHLPERIFEKIDYLDYLMELDPEGIQKPRGWLRSAIEQNYGPPDGYKPKAEREAEALARQAEEEAYDAAIAQRENRSARTWKEWLIHAREVPQRLQALTDRLHDDLRLQMTRATFSTWVQNTVVTEHQEGRVEIAVPSRAAYEWLANRLNEQFQGVLRYQLAEEVRVSFRVVERLTGEGDAD